MNVGIIGMGLIGGSVAKAAAAYTNHRIYGYDIKDDVISDAVSRNIIDRKLDYENISTCELIIIALYPNLTIETVKKIAPYIDKDAVLVDCCGVKKYVVDRITPIAEKFGFTYIGCHPMAGYHMSGFSYSKENLFDGASFIMCPGNDVRYGKIKTTEDFFLSIGFGSVKMTTPENHDKIIAFTSQLCHIVSNAYVKNSAADEHMGFSAGSYKDLTRVAKLDENMWTELFLENRENLIEQLDEMIDNLVKYSIALKNNDADTLKELLKEGRIRKETIDGKIYRD